jgi:hypothetical protein
MLHLQKYWTDFDKIWFRGGKKVKLPLCLSNEAPRLENVQGSGGIAPPFLTSALDGGEWSVSRPGPGEGALVPTGWAAGIVLAWFNLVFRISLILPLYYMNWKHKFTAFCRRNARGTNIFTLCKIETFVSIFNETCIKKGTNAGKGRKRETKLKMFTV